MWSLLTRVTGKTPEEYVLKPGKTIIGRKSGNDIAIADPSASRLHAELNLDKGTNAVTLSDLGSTNGTFINRERITVPVLLSNNDLIRIGSTTIDVSFQPKGTKKMDYSGAHRFTRELVLESLDHHAVLVYDVARQLNMVTDIDTALREVSILMKRSMGADRCEVILAEKFDQLSEMRFPTSIAESVIGQGSAVIVQDMTSSSHGELGSSSALLRIRSALCVPIMTGEEVIALIYMYKTDDNSRPFSQKDLQLAVAISHQAALTIQRMDLLERIRQEQRVHELLQRFVSPTEVKYLADSYLKDGHLPGLMGREVTVLFADIANSTTIAEKIGADGFGQILDQYYKNMTDLVFKFNGVIKFMGDGIMAVFGMTDSRISNPSVGNHAVQGVKSGLAILNHFDEAEYAENLQMGIGVNSGTAMVGYVGTEQRVELTAVGDIVNVAFRLEKLARPNRLLIGTETAVEIAGQYPLSDLGLQNIRGRTQPTRVYEVLRKLQNILG